MIDHLSPCDVQTTGDCTCPHNAPKPRVKGDSPLGRIRELLKHLDHWESQGHKTAGTDYLRRHFKDFT